MQEIPLVRICNVVGIEDDNEGDRIQVRLAPEDNTISNDKDLPFAFPLLPKMFYTKPKKGEAVFVFTALANNGYTQRYYIGPVISQIDKINKDPYNTTALSLLQGCPQSPSLAPSKKEDSQGVFLKNDDIGVLGRGVADVQIKEDELRLRCGVKKGVKEKKLKFNITDPAYIKMKYYDVGIGQDIRGKEKCNSTITLVADKINLIGNNSKDGFRVRDNEDLITDEEMQKIIQKAHQVPYGDVLVDFLKQFRNVFLSHTHSFSMKIPVLDKDAVALSTYNIDSMLSDSVRTS